MKLAVININGRFLSQNFLEKYEEARIEYDFDTNLDDFLLHHPNLNEYRGVLMHPPLGYHKPWLDKIQNDFPGVKIAFATKSLESTLQGMKVTGEIPLLDFKDVERIKEYFEI